VRDHVDAFNGMLARLEAAFQRLGDYSADIAHELRTPISNLMTQTQVALSRPRTIDEYQDILASNLEEYERIARMVSDMLFLAKAEENTLAHAGDPSTWPARQTHSSTSTRRWPTSARSASCARARRAFRVIA
jgi:two-component system heavy metal sensor histidine kinase CusS